MCSSYPVCIDENVANFIYLLSMLQKSVSSDEADHMSSYLHFTYLSLEGLDRQLTGRGDPDGLVTTEKLYDKNSAHFLTTENHHSTNLSKLNCALMAPRQNHCCR